MIRPLTSKQQRVLNAIREFHRENDRLPTYKELAGGLGYPSPNSIQQFIKVLSERKYLRLEKGQGIKSLEDVKADNVELVNVPLVGTVACGSPILAAENIEGYIPTDKQFIKNRPNQYFFLRAHGDSMNDAGIEDRDLLLIESKPAANSGEIVLALIEDEATVKIFKPQKDFTVLIPKSTNKKHKPIILSKDFKIQGVVRKVIQKKDLTA